MLLFLIKVTNVFAKKIFFMLIVKKNVKNVLIFVRNASILLDVWNVKIYMKFITQI
jgi:hypothetical protein